ncbi:hypothetical protein [Schlesneria sp. T3-172]|uniref:hypothetical protein n=1 Tax=Schlesneria sphaerica TaxID=3373610 RepID=UPI0037C54EE3
MVPHRIPGAVAARWIVALLLCAGFFRLAARAELFAASADDDEPRERLVMLTTGRILSGIVSRNGGGYLVEQPNGRLQIGNDEVQFVVDNLNEGYRKLRDSVVHPTPATHIDLATWCVSHRLYDEAQDELKKCLKADPENEQARRFLQRLTDTIRINTPPKGLPTTSPRKSSEGFLQPAAESLGGLSKESATLFTSRIQPLLLNKCGNASCHGVTTASEFRLYPARIGGNGSRQTTEKNLAEVLKQLDLDDVARSPLLEPTRASHGGRGTIFVGPAAAEQMKLLKAWAAAVAREKNPDARDSDQPASMAGFKSKRRSTKRIAQVVHEADVLKSSSVSDDVSEDDDDVAPAAATDLEVEGDSSESLASKGTRPRELGAESSEAKATPLKPFDAFDPEIFNRNFRRP